MVCLLCVVYAKPYHSSLPKKNASEILTQEDRLGLYHWSLVWAPDAVVEHIQEVDLVDRLGGPGVGRMLLVQGRVGMPMC